MCTFLSHYKDLPGKISPLSNNFILRTDFPSLADVHKVLTEQFIF